MKYSARQLCLSALMLALCLVLPLLTAQIPQIGRMLCPMHLPVLLCGFICGPAYGLLVGLIAPLLRSMVFGTPIFYPFAIGMCVELAAYGFFSGALYNILPRTRLNIYVSLITAMLIGRVLWGAARVVMSGADGSFTWALFLSGGFTTALPGIAVQIIFIPLIVMALRRARLI